MAFSTILHKRSSTQGSAPPPSSLSAGELAINTADGKLFIKSSNNQIKTFLNADLQPYSLNTSISSVNFLYGNNTATGILAGALGGIDNDVSGAGSTVVNGSDNDIAADYGFIGNGSNNKIYSQGDYGAILGGQNNVLNHQESFILGSNISSHLSGFTYVNNLSATGKYYGDGSSLTGIAAGDTEATTLVRSQSATWSAMLPLTGGTITGSLSVLGTSILNGVTELGNVENNTATIYVDTSKVGINTETPNEELTVVGDVSATGKYYGDGSELTGITAGDTEATTLVRSQSATWSAMLPLTGGSLTGSLTVAGTISASQTISMSGSRVIAGYSQDTTPVYYIRTLTQAEYNAIAVKDDNTIYFIKQ